MNRLKPRSYRFGARSKKNLAEAHMDLQKLFKEVIRDLDCAIIEGNRPKEEQEKAYHSGKSKLKFPESKHNRFPSWAVDVLPYINGKPIKWTDYKTFYYFAGFVKCLAVQYGINIRWGGDWDRDNDLNDQSFNDLVHWEITLIN